MLVCWRVPLRSSFLGREGKGKVSPVPSVFLHFCSRSWPSPSSSWACWVATPAHSLSLQTYCLHTAWSNKLHLPPAGSVALSTQLGTFLLPSKVQGQIRHRHPACPSPPKKHQARQNYTSFMFRLKHAENCILLVAFSEYQQNSGCLLNQQCLGWGEGVAFLFSCTWFSCLQNLCVSCFLRHIW